MRLWCWWCWAKSHILLTTYLQAPWPFQLWHTLQRLFRWCLTYSKYPCNSNNSHLLTTVRVTCRCSKITCICLKSHPRSSRNIGEIRISTIWNRERNSEEIPLWYYLSDDECGLHLNFNKTSEIKCFFIKEILFHFERLWQFVSSSNTDWRKPKLI